jgi:hypothetical protein
MREVSAEEDGVSHMLCCQLATLVSTPHSHSFSQSEAMDALGFDFFVGFFVQSMQMVAR